MKGIVNYRYGILSEGEVGAMRLLCLLRDLDICREVVGRIRWDVMEVWVKKYETA
jgi:hypothetical protein